MGFVETSGKKWAMLRVAIRRPTTVAFRRSKDLRRKIRLVTTQKEKSRLSVTQRESELHHEG